MRDQSEELRIHEGDVDIVLDITLHLGGDKLVQDFDHHRVQAYRKLRVIYCLCQILKSKEFLDHLFLWMGIKSLQELIR